MVCCGRSSPLTGFRCLSPESTSTQKAWRSSSIRKSLGVAPGCELCAFICAIVEREHAVITRSMRCEREDAGGRGFTGNRSTDAFFQTYCFSSRCDVISTETDGEDIVVRWRLSGRINLPFNPPIKPYVVTTTFERDSGAAGSQRIVRKCQGRMPLLVWACHFPADTSIHSIPEMKGA